MNITTKKRTGIAAVAASLFGLSGCSVIEAQYGEERYRSLEGKHLSELTRVIDIAAYKGQLIIASQGMSRGIGVVDTGTHMVTGFHSMREQPSSMELDTSGRLFMIQSDLDHGRKTGWMDLNSWSYYPTPSIDNKATQYFIAGSNVFAGITTYNPPDGWIEGVTQLTPQPTSLAPSGSERLKSAPTSLAVYEEKLFLSLQGSGYLQIRNRQPPFNLVDSINILPGHDSTVSWINIASLVLWKSKLFVLVQLPPDTTYLVILDAASGSRTGSIKLSFKQGNSGGVLNGIWYLYTKSLEGDHFNSQVLDGGVEAIDLESEMNLGTLITEVEIGGNVENFVPLSETTGYALYQNGKSGWDHLSVRKITYSQPVTARKAP